MNRASAPLPDIRGDTLEAIEMYGLEWEAGTSVATIELKCFRHFDKFKKAGAAVLSKHEHMLNAIHLLWTKEGINPRCDFRISPWTEMRVYAFCESEYKIDDENFQTWWGPASAGKTTDSAIILLTYWLAAPDETAVTVCSTTKEMLTQRIWGEMVKYYTMYDGTLPGKYMSSKTQITLKDENTKNCIRGIAVADGSPQEAKNNIIGVHNVYNVLCIDEMQHPKMSPAVEAITNLSTGCREFKFLGMGNPDSWLNPLGIESEPTDGKKSITPDMDGWPTKRGKTKYYDGYKSPGITDPDKFPFLLQQKDIDKTIEDFGEDHPHFWSMRRGFIPPAGLINTVFTEEMLVSYGMQDPPEWLETPEHCAAVDPAYSSGGNNCILYPFMVGMAKPGIKVIAFAKPQKITIEASSKEPITMLLARKIVEWCNLNGIKPNRLALDTSVSQFMLADVIESSLYKFGAGVLRVNFGGSASANPISDSDTKPGHEAYANRVTELWYSLAQLGRSGMIRGLKDYDTCRQLCMRRLSESRNKRIAIETKKDMKKRLNGNSPDEADAAAVAGCLAKEVLGVIPSRTTSQQVKKSLLKTQQKYDIDGRENNYLGDTDNGPEDSYADERIDDSMFRPI